ncbi:MAG: redox-regulated ATPase YchF [Candidatus Aminicenantes bacterium]|nr:redox-regulated ATPase YchF [Candidatus Aminicenantes bacterium]
MNLTLFGYPRTGKTTLFNLFTGAAVEVKAYDEGKKETNQRTCPLPDSRLDRIASLYPDKKKINAAVEVVDLAGISFGEVKTSVYLSSLRKADGLAHVIRGFIDPQIPHPRGRISPCEDLAFMEEELILADLVSVSARLEKLEKDLRKARDPEGEKEKELLSLIRASLEEGKSIRELSFSPAEEKRTRSFAFLSQKPLLHMINVDETDIPLIESPRDICPGRKPGPEILAFCGKVETEILELEEEEKETFLAEYGLRELSSTRFFRVIPSLLKIISFFTIGKNEVRAWVVPLNSEAGQAAGAIHSDMERGFIRAEVISWERLLELGSWQAAKDKGAVRIEGKEYIVEDGDVIFFRFAA